MSNDLLQKAFLEESDGIARYNQALEMHLHDEKSASPADSTIVYQDDTVDLKNKIRDLETQLEQKDKIIEEKQSIILEQIKVIQDLASKLQKTIFDSISSLVNSL